MGYRITDMRSAKLRFGFFGLVWIAVVAPGAKADFVAATLGTAGPSYYAILATGAGLTESLNGPGGTTGNVGIALNGDLALNGSKAGTPEITGNVYFQGTCNFGGSSSSSCPPAGQVSGSVFTNQNVSNPGAMRHVDVDISTANNASTTFNSLAPTQTVAGGQITGSQTIFGAPGVNVIDITNLNLGNGQTLTLNGPAGADFIINDSGNFTLNSGNIVESGGTNSSSVVFNVTSSGNSISASGGLNNESVVNGIILAPSANVQFAPGLDIPEIIAGEINLVSGGQVNGAPPVPEPEYMPLLGAGLAGAIAFVYKKRTSTARSRLN
jgi:hypothetical protein